MNVPRVVTVIRPTELEALLARHGTRAQARFFLERRGQRIEELDDGQRLLALNEVFIGHRSHQSARYRLVAGGREERQSSSGIVIASGTGSTGWARAISGQRRMPFELPKPAAGRRRQRDR